MFVAFPQKPSPLLNLPNIPGKLSVVCPFSPDAETKVQMLSNMYPISNASSSGQIPSLNQCFLTNLGTPLVNLVLGCELCMGRPCMEGHTASLAHGQKKYQQQPQNIPIPHVEDCYPAEENSCSKRFFEHEDNKNWRGASF